MAEQSHLPELPLMLASVPRQVVDLLRAAGVPVETLPRVTLLASGSGRFVLFDSLSSASVSAARGAARQGLSPINLRELSDPSDWPELAAVPAGSGPSDAPRQFLERLKIELERLGGVWIRLADYPFPYQSAMSLAIEHVSDDLSDFATIAEGLSGKATHFVSSRLRGAALLPLIQNPPVDLGWQTLREDCESSRRGTLSHWRTRLERFRAAQLDPRGLLITQSDLALPANRALLTLGFRYACHPGPGTACQLEQPGRSAATPTWMRFGTAPLPAREAFVDWIGEHYQSGYPLFLTAATDRLQLLQKLLTLVGNASRCSLMWQTSLGEFTRWWQLRRQMRIQVWRRDAGYEIHADGDFGNMLWSVEIWRGNHVAAVPLPTPELHVPDNGLVYLRALKKTLAGCTAPNDTVLELLSPEANPHLAV
jgi:hypothetical protein